MKTCDECRGFLQLIREWYRDNELIKMFRCTQCGSRFVEAYGYFVKLVG